VGKVIAHRLSRKDAADLLTPPAQGVDTAALARDAAEVWERLGLGRQRAILDALVIVTVMPQWHGRMPDGQSQARISCVISLSPLGRKWTSYFGWLGRSTTTLHVTATPCSAL
jgi:hypothetical protein